MARHLKSIAAVVAGTLASRVLGLLRDVLVFALLGAGALNSAFLIAFTVPNLFRRLLGEGALTSALVPVLTDALEQDGRGGGFAFLNKVLTRLVALLTVLTLLLLALYAALTWAPGLAARWETGAWLGRVLAPYLALVCLAAVFGAVLNVLGCFKLAALSAVWLNLAMIAALALAGIGWGLDGEGLALALSLGVLAGGAAQALLPALALWRHGWRPALDARGSDRLGELRRLFLPALAGAGIVQVNIAVSRLLAFAIDEGAVAQLYLANRLVELPMGLFAIAITTVMFPRIARLRTQGDTEGLRRAHAQGGRLILAITLPAAAGLLLLREPILRVLFEWGRFDAADVAATAPLLAVFALTVPLYSLSAYYTRSFHAMKDTRFPVRVAAVAFGVNTACSLGLMFVLGVLGLALANLVSVGAQVGLLAVGLARRHQVLRGAFGLRGAGPVFVAALLMSALVASGWWALAETALAPKLAALLALLVLIPGAVALYGGVLLLLRFEDARALPALLGRGLGGGTQARDRQAGADDNGGER
jgi:putative peptidoglycan lipid II flippase